MAITATITSKGQITLPKSVRKIINTNTVEIEIIGDEVRLRPVRSVAGALSSYVAGEAAPLAEVREKVWGEVARAKKR